MYKCMSSLTLAGLIFFTSAYANHQSITTSHHTPVSVSKDHNAHSRNINAVSNRFANPRQKLRNQKLDNRKSYFKKDIKKPGRKGYVGPK